MNVLNQLVNIYETKEKWHRTKLSQEEAEKYFQKVLEEGNLAFNTDERGMVNGILEWYCVNNEQFERLVNGGEFHIAEEDIKTGNICYVMDAWIEKSCRMKDVYKSLKKRLFEQTKHCKYYAGLEVKRGRRLRIFKKGE